MQCVTPMYRRYKKGDHSNGQIISRQEAMQELEADKNNARHKLIEYNQKSAFYQFEQIPCKKCWACQLNYAAEWATRITLEAKKYEHNYYITLTYSDEYVPILSAITYEEKYKENDETVKIEEITVENDGTWKYSLCPDHMITFLNSIRQYFHRKGHDGIKYFYCGEYGTENQRPHYHIIILNCPLDINQFYDFHIDQKFYKAHWKSKEIEKYWEKGIIDIAEVEWSCIAYVARYCTKKLDFTQDKRVYLNKGLIPEYVRMSKGMGYDYFKEHYKEIYKTDEMIMKTVKGNTGSYKPPKAFDRLIKEKDPKAFKKIQESRKKAGDRARKLQQSITDYTDLEMLRIKASNLQTKMSMLPRAGEW